MRILFIFLLLLCVMAYMSLMMLAILWRSSVILLFLALIFPLSLAWLSTWRKTRRRFLIIWVFINCPFREWPKWQKHHQELMRRTHDPNCAIAIEARKEAGIIHQMVKDITKDIADHFGLPVELLRQSDRFGQELYLPSRLQRNVEGEIFGLIDDLFEEQGMRSRLTGFPGPLHGMSVKQVVDWVSNTVQSVGSDVQSDM